MTEGPKFFGFAQLDFAGPLAVGDGRYVLRDGERERVLVLETLGAPPPPRRRRRRAREASADAEPAALPLARVTAVRAFEPFGTASEAAEWMELAMDSEEALDGLLDEALGLLNQALHGHAVASGEPQIPALTSRHAVAARVGFGSGAEVADGNFSAAREIDVRASGGSRRQRNSEELQPQERLAAVLGGRERFDACETLLLRARADLDARRTREAALQLRVGLEALLAELKGALANPDHDTDMGAIEARRQEAGELANQALQGDLSSDAVARLRELLETCERVLRRRRVLRG